MSRCIIPLCKKQCFVEKFSIWAKPVSHGLWEADTWGILLGHPPHFLHKHNEMQARSLQIFCAKSICRKRAVPMKILQGVSFVCGSPGYHCAQSVSRYNAPFSRKLKVGTFCHVHTISASFVVRIRFTLVLPNSRTQSFKEHRSLTSATVLARWRQRRMCGGFAKTPFCEKFRIAMIIILLLIYG